MSFAVPSPCRALRVIFPQIVCALLLLALPGVVRAADTPEIFPLSDVKAGMKATGLTIFAGDQIEKFDMTVLGVLPDYLGPRQSIILVQLVGEKVEHTGVVGGMSGSPVYIDGKLAGALSLKLGQFTKEPIAGVTPIESILEVSTGATKETSGKPTGGKAQAPANSGVPLQYPLPPQLPGMSLPHGMGPFHEGAFLTPIATPLNISGASPMAVAQFANALAGYGMVAVNGGSGTAQPDDAKIEAGDMVSVQLVRGDMSIGGACTVTAVWNGRVYACGHPIFGFGSVDMPLSRARVVTTLASDMDSIKIVTTGGMIGTITDDRLTAIAGMLGTQSRLIPMELSLDTPVAHRDFHFELADVPKLTPLLVGLVAYNGLTSNTAYGEGTTLKLSGDIDIAGHPSVHLANMFAPSDASVPDATFVAMNVQTLFTRVFTNPYEVPRIDHIRLKLESAPERRTTAIAGAWTDVGEAAPGDTVNVKVMLRPFRGAPSLQNVPITIPAQSNPGETLRIQVSDAASLNRTTHTGAAGASADLGGLDQLINILNTERRNNQFYVTLLNPSPTVLVEDKELPNAPLSELNILDQHRGVGGPTVLRESVAGEWSVATDSVVSGVVYLTIHIK
ncbi:MAG TPA: hypothetical protein VFO34_15505 [Candidatus Acidoferrales bacterium]|nr:hypothetical protein [Candidatus Acidoferrales bacterium]